MDTKVPQKVRIDLVLLIWDACPGLLIDSFDAHQPHETLHAIKHRGRSVSVETEIEAGEFGDRAAEQWALSVNPHAALFSVETKADLSRTAYPHSSAFVRDEMVVYRASDRGTPRNAIWVEHRHFTEDGVMRRVSRYRGETFVGTKAVKA